MVRWSNSPVFPNDLMWLLPIKVQAERSHFVFLLWRAGGLPDSPIAKLYVFLFITPCPHFRSFSPTMLDTAPSKCWFFLSFFLSFFPFLQRDAYYKTPQYHFSRKPSYESFRHLEWKYIKHLILKKALKRMLIAIISVSNWGGITWVLNCLSGISFSPPGCQLRINLVYSRIDSSTWVSFPGKRIYWLFNHFTNLLSTHNTQSPLHGHNISVGRKGCVRKHRAYFCFMLFLHNLYKCREKQIPTDAGWVLARLPFHPTSQNPEGWGDTANGPSAKQSAFPSQSLMWPDLRSPPTTQRCKQLPSNWHPHILLYFSFLYPTFSI